MVYSAIARYIALIALYHCRCIINFNMYSLLLGGTFGGRTGGDAGENGGDLKYRLNLWFASPPARAPRMTRGGGGGGGDRNHSGEKKRVEEDEDEET